ncbi:MAG TPA: carboxypeptidase-like regulatory domain-containing protein [Candidatus Acidoferrum sp.]|nr:carboxypeptidase-like regulatory domain-containing protein [Candidatus Acidoferrum sp.]
MGRVNKSCCFAFLQFAVILYFSSAIVAGQGLAVNQRTNAGTTFRIAGTVVSSLTGTPLGKTRVSLTDTANRKNTAFLITADDGHFVFTAVPRGKYSVQGAKIGFLTAAYEQHEEFSTAIVTGTDFNTENLVLRLTPLAFISGKVIDESGELVRKAQVNLYVDNQQGGRRRTVGINTVITDDQGYYEFSGLFPANYFISVSAKPWYTVPSFSTAGNGFASPPSVPASLDVAYPTTYNNGATDSQAATPIAIQGGDHLQVDLHLSPVPILHLTFRVPQTEEPQGISTPLFERRVFDSPEYVSVEGVQQISPGVFELAGIPAGKYTARFLEPKGQGQLSSEINLRQDGQEIDATQGEASATVKVTVKMPGNQSPSPQINIMLQDSHRQVLGFQAIDPAGEVELSNIPAGKYRILVNSPNGIYSVVRTISAGVESAGHELNVAAGSSVSVTVVLGLGLVGVQGFVKRGDKPASGVMVALIPIEQRSHVEMYRRDQSDSDGSFLLPAVIPGNYTLIAVEDAWGFQWQQPDVLNRYLRHGQNLTIGELMTATVHLPEAVQVQPR